MLLVNILETMRQVQKIIKSIVLDKKLISYGVLLLALHLVGIFVLYEIIPEFDSVIHFLFGFVLSEYVSKGAHSIALHEFLTNKLYKHKIVTKNPRRIDLLIRLLGFFLIGGLLWESAEFFIGPLVWRPADPFFTLPINLHNIDGAMDVTIGAIGTTVAWLCVSKDPEC